MDKKLVCSAEFEQLTETEMIEMEGSGLLTVRFNNCFIRNL